MSFNHSILITAIALLFVCEVPGPHEIRSTVACESDHSDMMVTQNLSNTGESTAAGQPFLKDCRYAADSLHAV